MIKSIKRKTAGFMAMIMCSLSLCSCGKNTPPLDPPVDPASEVSTVDKNMAFAAETSFTKYLKDKERKNVALDTDFRNSLNDFAAVSAAKLYESGQKGEENYNYLYSPVSLYLALALAADMTDTEVTKDLMAVLGAENKEELEKNVQDMIKTLSSETNDEGAQAICRIANSIWTDNDLELSQDAMLNLQNTSKKLFADIYNTDLQSQEGVDAMNKWVSDKTEGLIKEIPATPDANTLMVLFNTLYFKKEWKDQIDKKKTREERFTKSDGNVKMVDMMHTSVESGSYYRSENTISAPLYYNDGSYMVFILPDKGVDMQTVMNDDLGNIIDAYTYRKLESADKVNFGIPKVDYEMTSEDMIPVMKDMGVESIFTDADDPFSPIDEGKIGLFVAAIAQKCRIIIDEEGTEAAAVTEIMVDTKSAMPEPENEISIYLNREYAFVLMSSNNTPMFVGTVGRPE